MKKISVSIALLGWWLTAQVMAQDAGWINHFDGKPANYQIVRGNETLPIRFFTVLQVGDEISVNNNQDCITLSLRGGTQIVQITSENSPFQVDNASQVPEKFAKLWTWTKQQLSDWHKITQSVKSREFSEELTMPLLQNIKHQASLIAGKRALHLQWRGGKPPYQVQIKQRRKLLLTQISYTTAIETEAMNFKAGKPYRLVVTDAEGQIFIGGFRVFAPAQLASYPQISEDGNLPDYIRRTLQATWLVMQEDGKWIFEAYQQAAWLMEYQPAQLLKEALAVPGDKMLIRGLRG